MQDIVPIQSVYECTDSSASSNLSRLKEQDDPEKLAIEKAEKEYAEIAYQAEVELTGGVEVDSDQTGSAKQFKNGNLNKEQAILDMRQFKTIEKMLDEGNMDEKQKNEADLFLEYALDKLSEQNVDSSGQIS